MVLLREKHNVYLASLDSSVAKESFEYHATEHLRISGVYWGYTASMLLGSELSVMPSPSAIEEFCWKCYDPETGGFGGNIGHDAHILHTLSAIQLLVQVGRTDRLLDDAVRSKVVSFIRELQNPDGSVSGDKYGEVDSRFVLCAFLSLKLLKCLDAIDVDSSLRWLSSCRNFDAGYGAVPGAESHAAQIWTIVAAFAVADRVSPRDPCAPESLTASVQNSASEGRCVLFPTDDALSWWLAERQNACDGGLNGRPEKSSDVCYSWWVLASLEILGRLDWINRDGLRGFIQKCQDEENGGIADAPGNYPDVWHTFFGIAGLSLLAVDRAQIRRWFDELKSSSGGPADSSQLFSVIDPRYAMPVPVLYRVFGDSYSLWF
eukprot:ANDGO_01799.mRNA.1 putative geranylgeranyl transferase type-2 subunit beta